MLIILCLLAGAGFSLGVCLGADAFLSLSWLYLLPLGFLGGTVLAVILAAAFLIIACAVVDMKVLPDKDSKFYRKMTYLYIDAVKTVLGLKIETEGLEKTPTDTRFLLVCNHISDLDPVVLLYTFHKSTMAFISKRENDQKPIVGQIQRKILCQPINRENDREALKTILRCIQLIKRIKCPSACSRRVIPAWTASFAISATVFLRSLKRQMCRWRSVPFRVHSSL